jgi:hypothetical protein
MKCPEHIAARITAAGGKNCFGEPMFRVVWGFDRIVPFHGFWEDTGRIETRHEPKYLPADRWHLEGWRPPEEYGTPESWKKAGEEIRVGATVDTAGPFPSRGEYELVLTFQSEQGEFVPLNATTCEWVVQAITFGRNNFSFHMRRQAILQREARAKKNRIDERQGKMLENLRPFCSNPFVTVPGNPTEKRTKGGIVLVN